MSTIRPYQHAFDLHYIRSSLQADRALHAIAGGTIGFDIEWRPNFVKGEQENPVALVQLACARTVWLIQLSAMTTFPKRLREILESPDIAKAGVAIQGDVKRLHRDYNVSTRNCVDLSLLARTVDNARWKGKYSNAIGLARLVETYEQMSLPKGQQLSNWEAVLTKEQQQYAANDAHSALIVYMRLHPMLRFTTPTPRPTCYTFDFVRGRLCEPTGAYWHPFNPNYDPGPRPPPRTAGDDGVQQRTNRKRPPGSKRYPGPSPVGMTASTSDQAGGSTVVHRTGLAIVQPISHEPRRPANLVHMTGLAIYEPVYQEPRRAVNPDTDDTIYCIF